MSKILLKVDKLSLSFRGLQVLKNISFDMKEGILGIIGPNGAGKSSLFNCLTGFYQYSAGTIFYRDNLLPKKPFLISRYGIARTFQNIRLFHNMTLLENVQIGQYKLSNTSLLSIVLNTNKYKKKESVLVDEAMSILEFVGLKDKYNMFSYSLSYGEQRKLEIARALATKPTLLMLDEPTAGMNHKEMENIEILIKKIYNTNIPIILIDHDMKFIFNICPDIMLMIGGEKVVEGTPEIVKSNKRFISEYMGDVIK